MRQLKNTHKKKSKNLPRKTPKPSEMMYEGTEILGKTLSSLGLRWSWFLGRHIKLELETVQVPWYVPVVLRQVCASQNDIIYLL